MYKSLVLYFNSVINVDSLTPNMAANPFSLLCLCVKVGEGLLGGFLVIMQLKASCPVELGDSLWRDFKTATGDTDYVAAVTAHKGERGHSSRHRAGRFFNGMHR